MYDVITMGSATIDVFAHTSSELVKFVTPKGEQDYISYPSGSKILINNLDFLVGGGGTNTAVSFARLGLHTAFLGKLGHDSNGQKVLEALGKEHVDFLGEMNGQTGYSIVLDSIERDRTILTFKGTNDELGIEDVPFEQLEAKWLYSSSLVGHSFKTLSAVFSHAKDHGIKIAFNPSNYQAKLGMKYLQNILNCCDVVVMNLEEAQLLIGEILPAETLATMIAQGTSRIVVITDGPKGAVCQASGKIYHIFPSKHTSVIETTGAGDAFASGFVAGLIYNFDIEDALKLGVIQAESVIQDHGAKNNLLYQKDAMNKMHMYKGDISEEEAETLINTVSQDAVAIHGKYAVVNEEHAFNLPTGKKLYSVEELAYYLHFGGHEEYTALVTSDDNHFATWVSQVFHLENLAQAMQATTTKEELVTVLLSFIHKDVTNYY